MTLTEEEITTLVAQALREVLALEEAPAGGARLDTDLHADSLDLVETVELVESALRERTGREVRLADDVVRRLRTVDDAVGAVRAAVEAHA